MIAVTKEITPETASVAASTISTTPTVTVTTSWACSRTQVDAATTGRCGGSAAALGMSLTRL